MTTLPVQLESAACVHGLANGGHTVSVVPEYLVGRTIVEDGKAGESVSDLVQVASQARRGQSAPGQWEYPDGTPDTIEARK